MHIFTVYLFYDALDVSKRGVSKSVENYSTDERCYMGRS